MISSSVRYLGSLAAIFALSACAKMEGADEPAMQEPAEEAEAMETMNGPFEPDEDLVLKVDLVDAPAAVASERALGRALGSYGVPRPPNANLGEWIMAIRNAGGGHGARVMRGLGGMQARDFLRVADRAVDENGNYEEPRAVDVWGQIQEECEDGSGNMVPGYYFDGNAPDGSGHLCVMVVTEATNADGDTHKWAEKYFVAVNDGYQVEGRDYDDPDTAFPDFTGKSGLPIPQSVAGNFDQKLWASGKSIRVERLWVDTSYDEADEQFEEVVPGTPLWPVYATVFAPDQDACVDMMFLTTPPSPHLPPDMAPPQYCLGRCDDPPLINTK